MKKYISLLLALCLIAGILSGCGSQEPVAGEITPATEAPEAKVSLGTTSGSVYTNTYTGYVCTLDSDWTVYPAEQLQDLPENIAELMEGTELAENGAFLNQLTDMMAENVTALTTINVLYQKLNATEQLAYTALGEEGILDSVLGQADVLTEAYAQAGITVEKLEKIQVTFLGETRYAMHMNATMQGIAYHTLQIYDYHGGGYAVITTLASYIEDNTQNLLELFAPVE